MQQCRRSSVAVDLTASAALFHTEADYDDESTVLWPQQWIARRRLLPLVYERHQVIEIGAGSLGGGGEPFRWGERSIYPERAIAVDAGAERVLGDVQKSV